MKYRTISAALLFSMLSVFFVSMPATADELSPDTQVLDADSPIDPDLFSGTVIVATPQGEVVTRVSAGQLEQRILDVRAAASNGDMTKYALKTKGVGCGVWVYSIASPGGYAQSIDGCAVAGYPGYVRTYNWSNASDVSVCTQGRGWNGSSAVWRSMGCIGWSGQGQSSGTVQWGNVLAYTKMSGLSASGVTGAAYRWLT